MASAELQTGLELSLAAEKDAVLSLGPPHNTSMAAKRLAAHALDATGNLKDPV
jgi:hypothetical protein